MTFSTLPVLASMWSMTTTATETGEDIIDGDLGITSVMARHSATVDLEILTMADSTPGIMASTAITIGTIHTTATIATDIIHIALREDMLQPAIISTQVVAPITTTTMEVQDLTMALVEEEQEALQQGLHLV